MKQRGLTSGQAHGQDTVNRRIKKCVIDEKPDAAIGIAKLSEQKAI
ncbi:MAG: hypothetical protein JW764_07135 [Chlorobiaceae bacterium]|nr:hypothetical protein [Chlorobiaceae bacterium]